MKITKTTRNMAERRGMTVYVGDEMQCITIALAGKDSDCFVMYSIKEGVLLSYCCTIQHIIQLSDFPSVIRTEAELRASLDAIRSVLYDIMKYGNVVEPAVVEPEVVPVAVPEDEILSETEVNWNESQYDNVESGTIVYVIRHETGKYYHATSYVSLCWENEWNAASEYFTANRALEVVNGLKYTGNKCKVYRREYRG